MQSDRPSNPKVWNSALVKLVIVSGLLLCWDACLPLNSWAATAQGYATLALRVEPAAVMTVNPAVAANQLGSSQNNALVRIDLVVRMNPGVTASLWLYPMPDSTASAGAGTAGLSASSGGPDMAAPGVTAEDRPKLILTVSRNGRYSLTVGVGSLSGSAPNTKARVELKTSDQALAISKTF